MMKKMVVLGGLLFALGACGSKDKFDQALDDMAGFKDKMCACKDKECVLKVDHEFRDWRKSLKDKLGDTKPNADQDKKGEALNKDLRACFDKQA